jgi:hypothetical protein
MTSSDDSFISIGSEQQREIERLFDDLPVSPDERLAQLQSLRRAFYLVLAKQAEPALNTAAAGRPHETSEERRELAAWVNKTVRDLGLALIYPEAANEAAILLAEASGRGQQREQKFRFQSRSRAGGRIRSSMNWELPELRLMPAPSRVENLSREYADRSGTER